MRPGERLNDFQEALLAALGGFEARVWTALPGLVNSFDATAMTCTVQPTIMGSYRDAAGTLQNVTMPLLLDCPVVFPGGGGVTLTFPLAAGDEVLVVFSSRCIDAWWQSGGVQPQAEFRMHDLSDGFVIAGVRSQPRRLTVSTSAAQLRTDSGNTLIEINPSGELMTLKSPNPITVDAPGLIVNGYLQTNSVAGADASATIHGDIKADGAVTAGQGTGDEVNLQTHTHGGVQAGGAHTAEPDAGT